MGADMERSFGRLLDCDCCSGPRGSADAAQEKRFLSELRSAVKRKCCVWGRPGLSGDQPIIGIPAQLCENICSLTCHIGTIWKQTERNRNPQRGKPWSFGFGGNLLISVTLHVFWWSLKNAPCPVFLFTVILISEL